MAQKMDFLFTVESNTGYLDGAIKTLEIITDNLYRDLMVRKDMSPSEPVDWTERHYAAIYTVLRNFSRIQEELSAAVEEIYQEKQNHATQMGGE